MKEEMQSGARIYSKPALQLYDFVVLKFSNTFAWKCPSKILLDLYNTNISANHLDIGVGTGYFLDKCTFPKPPKISLLDLNPNTLDVSAQRISRYKPETHQGDILEPVSLPQFDSIAINYLLHCLPGDLRSKEMVFKNGRALLNKNGVLFGATILGDMSRSNFLAKKLLTLYNSKKIFSNLNDKIEDLEALLAKHFKRYTLKQQGQVAIFTAHA
jgi:ubiquinone/menaquinone biosynthesis C-methylase UbiE